MRKNNDLMLIKTVEKFQNEHVLFFYYTSFKFISAYVHSRIRFFCICPANLCQPNLEKNSDRHLSHPELDFI